MLTLVLIVITIMLAFTIIAILCAREIARPREAHFGWPARRPIAGSGRFLLPSTRIAARNTTAGGAHVAAR